MCGFRLSALLPKAAFLVNREIIVQKLKWIICSIAGSQSLGKVPTLLTEPIQNLLIFLQCEVPENTNTSRTK